MANPLEQLIEGLLNGEAAAISRAITLVENSEDDKRLIIEAILPRLGKALVVGITGAPGVGKSTLVDACIKAYRDRGKTVGVVAVDPSSPISGGAVLGDRVRMVDHASDPGVFIRSLSSRGRVGGLSAATIHAVDILDAAGKDIVIIETVGAGQSEVELMEVADIKVVVCAPGLGDSVQTLKAGILEIADILVVNKSDLPDAARTAAQLKAMVRLRQGDASRVPVVATTATEAAGIPDLVDGIGEAAAKRRAKQPADLVYRTKRILAELCVRRVTDVLLNNQDKFIDRLCDRIVAGDIGLEDAMTKIFGQKFSGPK